MIQAYTATSYLTGEHTASIRDGRMYRNVSDPSIARINATLKGDHIVTRRGRDGSFMVKVFVLKG